MPSAIYCYLRSTAICDLLLSAILCYLQLSIYCEVFRSRVTVSTVEAPGRSKLLRWGHELRLSCIPSVSVNSNAVSASASPAVLLRHTLPRLLLLHSLRRLSFACVCCPPLLPISFPFPSSARLPLSLHREMPSARHFEEPAISRIACSAFSGGMGDFFPSPLQPRCRACNALTRFRHSQPASPPFAWHTSRPHFPDSP